MLNLIRGLLCYGFIFAWWAWWAAWTTYGYLKGLPLGE